MHRPASIPPGGGGGWHKASVLGCLPLAVPIGLSPLLILTLCGFERVLVVSMEPLDGLSCLTTPGSAVPETGCCPCRSPGASRRTLRVDAGFADSSTDLCALGCASAGSASAGGGGGGQGLGIRLFAFGGAYWPLLILTLCGSERVLVVWGAGGSSQFHASLSSATVCRRASQCQRDVRSRIPNLLPSQKCLMMVFGKCWLPDAAGSGPPGADLISLPGAAPHHANSCRTRTTVPLVLRALNLPTGTGVTWAAFCNVLLSSCKLQHYWGPHFVKTARKGSRYLHQNGAELDACPPPLGRQNVFKMNTGALETGFVFVCVLHFSCTVLSPWRYCLVLLDSLWYQDSCTWEHMRLHAKDIGMRQQFTSWLEYLKICSTF